MNRFRKTGFVLFLISIFLITGLSAAIVYTNGFEKDNGGGVVTGDAVWEWGKPNSSDYNANNPPSGTNCWGTVLSGYYGNNQSTYLTFSNINLTNSDYATIEFDLYHYFPSVLDGADLMISTNDSLFFKVGTYSEFYNNSSIPILPGAGWSYRNYSWYHKQLDLSDYVPATVDIQFRMKSDASGTGYGIYIDNLTIKDTPIPVAGKGSSYWYDWNDQQGFVSSTNTYEITFYPGIQLINGSKVAVTIPSGFTSPQITSSNQLGYITAVVQSGSPVFNSKPQIIGNKAIFTITNMAKSDYIKIIYGQGLGAKTSSASGEYTFVVETANPIENLASIGLSPKVKLYQPLSVPYVQTFETNSSGWYEDGNYHQWALGSPSIIGPSSSYSGTKCWGVNLSGGYNNTWADEPLYTPPFKLQNLSQAYLEFYHYFDFYKDSSMMNDDGGAVMISTNGNSWSILGYYPIQYNHDGSDGWWNWGAPYWSESIADWTKVTIDLKDYLGKTIFLKFQFSSSGNASSSYAGWYVDDFKILTNKLSVAGTGISSISNNTAPTATVKNFVLTYTAGVNIQNGSVEFTIPSDWTVPQSSNPANPGYIRVLPTTETNVFVNPTPIISGQTITIAISNLPFLKSFSIAYSNATTGNTSGVVSFPVRSAGQGESLSNLNVYPYVTLIPKISTFPYTESFESDNGHFSLENANNIWEWGIPKVEEGDEYGKRLTPTNAYAGIKVWGTLISNYYTPDTMCMGNNEYSLLSPYFDLTGQTKAYLSFAYFIDVETMAWDIGAQVLISTNDRDYYPLGSYPNFYNTLNNHWDNDIMMWTSTIKKQSTQWELAQLDLNQYIGKSVRLKFKFINNCTMEPMHSGFYIDNIHIDTNYVPFAGTGFGYSSFSAVKPGIVTNLNILYEAGQSCYGGYIDFTIPSNWTAPQTNNSMNPGYISVTPLSNANIQPQVQISGTGPWTVRVTISTMAYDGAIQLFYNQTTVPSDYTPQIFEIKTGSFNETMTSIANSPVVYVLKTINSFPFIADFETNNNYFYSSDFGQYQTIWQRGIPVNYAPTNVYSEMNCWGTKLSNYYTPENSWDDNRKYILYSPIIDLTTSTNPMYVEWSYYLDIEPGWDKGVVFGVSVNGSPVQQIGSYGLIYNNSAGMWDNQESMNYDWLNGQSSGWKTLRFDLMPYMGQQVQFSFRFYNKQTVEPNHTGIYIDKFIINNGVPPIAGSGSFEVSPVASGPTALGDYIFEYISEYDFFPGFVSLTIPTNWSSPQTSNSNNSGYVSILAVSNGIVNPSLQISNNIVKIEVTNLMIGGEIYLLYKNAVSPSVSGVSVFTMKSALVSETLTALSESPTLTVLPVKTPPFTEDFESDNGGFSQLGSIYDKWEWGVPSWQPSDAYSGSKCWGTVLDDNIIDKQCSEDLYSPIIDLTSLSAASVVFYHWYDVNDWDAGCVVTITTDFENYQQLGNYPNDYNKSSLGWQWWGEKNSEFSGMDGYGGNSGGWIKEAFDLSPYVGKYVVLRFHFGNSQWDGMAMQKSGWFIDTVSFLDTPPPVAGTGTCTVSPSSALVGGTNIHTFTFTAEENMYTGSEIKFYFPDNLPLPELYAVSSLPATFIQETYNSETFNVMEISLSSPLNQGNTFEVYYTNRPTANQGGMYTIYVTTKGSWESSGEVIQNSPTISIQEIQSLPYKEDFEDNNGTWVSGVVDCNQSYNLWEWGTPDYDEGPSSAKSGSKCWGTKLTGNYNHSRAVEYLETPPINLTSETQAYLTFYQYFDTDIFGMQGDGGYLEISYGPSVDNMLLHETVGNNNDYNQNFVVSWGDMCTKWVNNFWGGNSGGWIKQSFNLNNYIGYYVKLRFIFGSDWDVSDRPGWYIDKVSIDSVAPAPPTIIYEDSKNTYGNYSTAGVEFSDVDNDGDLDMVANNFLQSYNIVWKNNGSASFSQSESVGKNSAFISVLADFNNDGFVDIFNGNGRGEAFPDSPQNNEVYLNKGNGSFELAQTIGNNITMDADSGDIDFDGDIDIVVANIGANDLLINDGSGKFSESSVLMPGDETYVVKLFDADGDGDLDIFLGNYSPERSKILLNNGSGSFTESTNFSGKFKLRAVAIGDIDADGDEDMVITGDGFISILTNTGTGRFDELSDSSIQIRYQEDITNNIMPTVKLADMDNDGDLDIVVGTYLAGNRIFLNEGNYLFKDSNNELGFYPTYSLALADIDKDGDLDIGEGNFSKQPNRIWNGYVTNTLNTKPSVPDSLSAVIENDVLTINWSAGSDNETPTNLLTYNLRVGTTENGNDVYSLSGGKHPLYFSGPGNMGHNYSFHINNINKISYYYVSLQTVDSGFRGSSWKTITVYYDNQAPEANKIKLSDNFLNLNDTESSILSFNLKDAGKVSIYIYNIQGVKVRTLVSDKQYNAGYNYQNNITWDGTNDDNEKLAPGLYWVVIRGESFTDKKKILLVW